MSIFQDIKDIFIPQANKSSNKNRLQYGNERPEVDHESKEAAYVDESRKPSFARKLGPVTQKLVESHYRRNPNSFADRLSITEYLEESKTFMLEDCYSQAVVFAASPIATEGRSKDQIAELRNTLQAAFKQAFGIAHGGSDWVLQIYSWKDDDLYRYVDEIYSSIHEEVRDTEFTEQFLDVLEEHFRGVNQAEGIFKDVQVTGKQWRGQMRRTYCVIYRRCSKLEIESASFDPINDINEVADRFSHLLSSSGVKIRRLDGETVFRWLTDWFNPNPPITNGDREALYRLVGYPKRKNDKPYGFNLAESVLFSEPISDPDNGCWWFDDMPHTFMRFKGLTQAPDMGQLTGEVSKGTGKNQRSSCLMDSVPAGAMLVQTIIFVSPTKIDSHLMSLSSAQKGETQEAQRAQQALNEVELQRQNDQDVFYASQGVYVRGENLVELQDRCKSLKNNLLSNGVMALDASTDPLITESYPLHLPGCFQPELDTKRQYMQLYYSQHLANMCPIFGREQGTGNPGLVVWNRGGEPLTLDMFGKDRVRAAHGVVIGPQGSGKSASLNYMAASVMAVHRPRLFILDKGGSFELLSEYFAQHGLTVNYMRINKSAKFSLCPFLDAGEVVKQIEEAKAKAKAAAMAAQNETPAEEVDEDEDDAPRDPLGEMEQSLYIMVTGGNMEAFARITQLDKALMRAAILAAGIKSLRDGKKTLTQDVREAMLDIAEREVKLEPDQRTRLKELAASLELYCTGELDARMFNTVGEPWPDADVTVLDVGVYGSDRYPAQLALAYIGYMQRVINKAEETQSQRRDVVNIVDEAHLYTGNPLLGYQIAFAVKVARKIGLWMLLATQNVEDFSKGDDIKKVLGLFEWWFLLNMEYKEVEDLSKYRNLTPEQKVMILSCSKQQRAYTEGVVMGNPKTVGEMLVRQVPPSIFLTLAMTDPNEKNERRALMEQYGLSSQYQAAEMMAQELNRKRGLKTRPRSSDAVCRSQRLQEAS